MLRNLCFSGVSIVVLLAFAVPAVAKPAVELGPVPEPLLLPLPAGSNQFLTAGLSEGQAEAGWVAPAGHADLRLMLTPAGGGKFKLNLANRDLSRLLRAARSSAFRVHLRASDGQVARSVKLQAVHPSDYRLELEPFGLEANKKHKRRALGRRAWVNPDRFKAIGVSSKRVPSNAKVVASVGEKNTWALGAAQLKAQGDKSEQVLLLKLNDKRRAAWRRAGKLRIEGRIGEYQLGRRELKVKPDALVSADQSQTFVIDQRDRRALPGSNGYLLLRLGDITDGQVLMELRRADREKPMIKRRSIKQGETVTFQYAGQRYALKAQRLVNVLIGTDHMEAKLSRPAEASAGD